MNTDAIYTAPVLVIVGSTASGKSALAVDIALRYGGEIISADSRQVYASLVHTVGKVSEEEMRGVPHYMLSEVSVGDYYSAHAFAERAVPLVSDIRSRGALPIITGGTGFYIDAVLFEGALSEVPPDPVYRRNAERKNIQALRQELQERDPDAYATIDADNPRRIIRALEIIRGGTPFRRKRTKRFSYMMIGIRHNREHLYRRIARRLDERFEAMTEEMRVLLNAGTDPMWFDSLGLECRHLSRMLVRRISKEETRENLFRAITAYAKRQETWWRRYPEARWFYEHEFSALYRLLDGEYGGSART